MRLFRALVALALCGCAFASFADPVSFADLARHLQFQRVKISPDGGHLAATSVMKNGQSVLTLFDLTTLKAINLSPRMDEDVLDFWWVSPERLVYTEAEHDGGWDLPLATGELYGVNADGSGAALLYGYRRAGTQTGSLLKHASAELGYARFLSRIAGDDLHVLVAITDSEVSGSAGAVTAVYRMDVRDGSKVKVAMAPMREASYLADHKGNVRFAWAPDLKGNQQIYMRVPDGGDWQLLPRASADRDTPIAFSDDDSVVWFTCPAPGGFGVCRFDPASRKTIVVWSNPNVEADGLAQGLSGESLMGVRYIDGRPSMALFDPKSPDGQALIALMQHFPGENVQFVSGTDDGSKTIAFVDADVDPGTFYLYDRAGNKLSPLLQRASWINPANMARKQPITLAARDGLKLHGYISYPPGKGEAKNLPMVVFVHGGPFGPRDDWSYDNYVQAMATHGYAVLQVNYRGSGGYGYDFQKAGYREWGGKMQDDVTDATRWAIAQGIADPNRICIFGGSYGGYAALEGAVKEPDLYKCAIGYVGVYDLRKLVDRDDDWVTSYDIDFWKRTVGTDDTVLAQHSPIYQLGNLKAKVMLIVGGKDKIVLPGQGRELHAAMQERGIPHEWLYEPDEWHGFYTEEHVEELFSKIDAFLDANIGGGGAGASVTAARRE